VHCSTTVRTKLQGAPTNYQPLTIAVVGLSKRWRLHRQTGDCR